MSGQYKDQAETVMVSTVSFHLGHYDGTQSKQHTHRPSEGECAP